jgi:hypothetical protein
MFATLLATAATQNAITILGKPFVVWQRREALKKLTIFYQTKKYFKFNLFLKFYWTSKYFKFNTMSLFYPTSIWLSLPIPNGG